jgi:hypothetical protein
LLLTWLAEASAEGVGTRYSRGGFHIHVFRAKVVLREFERELKEDPIRAASLVPQ